MNSVNHSVNLFSEFYLYYPLKISIALPLWFKTQNKITWLFINEYDDQRRPCQFQVK